MKRKLSLISIFSVFHNLISLFEYIASFYHKDISKTTVKIFSHATNMYFLLQYFCSVLYCASLCAKASHWSLDECSIHLLLGSEMPLSIIRCHECILCVQFLSFYTCVIPHISLVVWKRCHENQTLKSLYDSKYWFYNTRYANCKFQGIIFQNITFIDHECRWNLT